MKKKKLLPLALLGFSIINSQLSTGFAQGSLTPSGPPGPTMLTLTQIQPRTPISSAPYNISSAGSYYLTANLTVSTGSAITVNASEVTLDLNGFCITGTGTAATAINLGTSPQDITVLNGHINGGYVYSAGNYTGSGFTNGITYNGVGSVRISGVTISGVASYGIGLGSGNTTCVESCIVNTAGGYGIMAGGISHSTASPCGNTAIDAYLNASDCFGNCTGSGDGVLAKTAINCIGQSSNGYGLFASQTATGCTGTSTSGTGLSAIAAQNCTGSSAGAGAGLSANTATGCTGNNSSSGDGVNVSYTALNCFGSSSSGTGLQAQNATGCNGVSSSGAGLNASNDAENSFGSSEFGTALQAQNATGCTGSGYAGAGLIASGSALNCYGYNHDLDTISLSAYIATSCVGSNGYGNVGLTATNANFCFGTPTIVISGNKYNMP